MLERITRERLLKRAHRLAFYDLGDLTHKLRAPHARRTSRQVVGGLPPLEWKFEDKPYELHMLCGHRSVDMGVWASYSFLRFLGCAKLYVHSDGTINSDDEEAWRSVIPWTSFVSRREADAEFDRVVGSRWPVLAKWRALNHTGLKLIDPHLYGRKQRLLLIDSDVLCFARPDRLISLLNSSDEVWAWNRDIADAYTVPRRELSRLFSCAVPERLNSGLFVIDRFELSSVSAIAGIIEEMSAAGWDEFSHYWYEQTIYAAFIGVIGAKKAHPLPTEYDCLLRSSPASQITQHYVGNGITRPRFFTEGIPRVRKSLSLSR